MSIFPRMGQANAGQTVSGLEYSGVTVIIVGNDIYSTLSQSQ